MTWFKVDDGLHSHPKAMAVPLEAVGLWTVAGSWSSDHLTDGFIPDYMISSLSRGRTELADQLVAARLWKRAKGGYRFHEWHADADGTARNPSREEVTAVRAKRAEAGRKGGLASGKSRSKTGSNREASASAPRSRTVEPPSRPVPSSKDDGALSAEGEGDQSVYARARTREATTWLHRTYGLTDREAAAVITEIERRAPRPIEHLKRYLELMNEGDRADLVKAAMDAERPPPPPDRPGPDIPEPPAPHIDPPAPFTDREPAPDRDEVYARGAQAVRAALTGRRTPPEGSDP